MNSGFFVLLILIIVLGLISCSPVLPPNPECRIEAKSRSDHQGPAACVVRVSDKLLSIKLMSNKYDLPYVENISPQSTNSSAQCNAHANVWETTGLNVRVKNVLGMQSNGTWLFACELKAGFIGNEAPFPPPQHGSNELKEIAFIDPFELQSREWAHPNDFVLVKDAFVSLANDK